MKNIGCTTLCTVVLDPQFYVQSNKEIVPKIGKTLKPQTFNFLGLKLWKQFEKQKSKKQRFNFLGFKLWKNTTFQLSRFKALENMRT